MYSYYIAQLSSADGFVMNYRRPVRPVPLALLPADATQAKANKFQTLCSFLPSIVLGKLSRLTRDEASSMRPEREDFHECAVVMLDMCVRFVCRASRRARACNRACCARKDQSSAATCTRTHIRSIRASSTGRYVSYRFFSHYWCIFHPIMYS